MRVKRIGDWTLEDRLAPGGPPVVVMFLSADSGPNRYVRYEFRRMAEKHPEATFYEVDLAENPSAAEQYSVGVHPMLQVFVDGTLEARHTGPWPAATILRVLERCRQARDTP